MRKYLFVLVLLCSFPCFSQNWKSVYEDEDGLIELDLSSLERDGNVAYIREKYTRVGEAKAKHIKKSIEYVKENFKDTPDEAPAKIAKWEKYNHTMTYYIYDLVNSRRALMGLMERDDEDKVLEYIDYMQDIKYHTLKPGTVGYLCWEIISNTLKQK